MILLSELKCKQFINDVVTLFSDSQATTQWIKCTSPSNKLWHMNLRFHFVRDFHGENVIKLDYIKNEVLTADFFLIKL